jgi:hypothetical protein
MLGTLYCQNTKEDGRMTTQIHGTLISQKTINLTVELIECQM